MEKLLEKMELNKKVSEVKMEEKVQSPEKSGKVDRNVDVVNWVDAKCAHFNKLVMIGSTITAK